ncbi:hypothetical protein KFL_006560050 [Klebsormidium nitens]|uniref:Uncharacterized protein n=1 Tax=Klebsormidium nitens TaxID=105231 RepID=A0A1Y1IN25_KLENI|nr:hypothetical protein KFL_006560050 [Klebsormidium nitens]|eukprot:GAQ90561.1 hypothetical protein KFL_006560050 [Klebsormidium nitens]
MAGGLETFAVHNASEEVMLLWSFRDPSRAKHYAFVSQKSRHLDAEVCGRNLRLVQSQMQSTVTGSVVWDSALVLAKFLEYAADQGWLDFRAKSCVELGAGCGLVGLTVAFLGAARVILTDMPDRLRLLRQNVEDNYVAPKGSPASLEVVELLWSTEPTAALLDPRPDWIVASDVVYDDETFADLLTTLKELSTSETTIIIAVELRIDSVIESFLEAALSHFSISRVADKSLHPEYKSQRVVVYLLRRKEKPVGGDGR